MTLDHFRGLDNGVGQPNQIEPSQEWLCQGQSEAFSPERSDHLESQQDRRKDLIARFHRLSHPIHCPAIATG